MSITRGGLTYTIPEALVPGTSKPVASQVQTMADIIIVNIQEFLGINSIWADPAISVSGALNSRHEAVPTNMRYPRRPAYANADVAAVRASFGAGNRLTVNTINNLINTYRWYESSGKNLVTSLNNVAFDGISAQGTNGTIDDAVMNAIATNMTKISDHLNGYNSWWSGDLCARTCQVSCQTACQIACQGCNNSTCHNQNCGGWS